MNKSGILLLIVVAVAVCVVALWVVHPRQPVPLPPAVPVSTEPGNPPAASQPTAELQKSESSTTSTTGESATSGALAATADASVAPAPAAPPEAAPEKPEELFLSDDEIAAAIRDKGGVAPVYLAATPSNREDIIDYLMSQGQLRDSLATLLPLETDSSLRAYMLERTVPKGYFDEAAETSSGPGSPGSLAEPPTDESATPPWTRRWKTSLTPPPPPP